MNANIFTQYNADSLRAVARQWERHGNCDGFSHLVACAITHTALKPRRRLPMYGDESDVNLLILAMGIAAGFIESEVHRQGNGK